MPIITLKFLRVRSAGLTQEELADLSGVSVDFIKRFEAERSYQQLFANIEAVAVAIGCDPRNIVLFPTAEEIARWEGDRDSLIRYLLEMGDFT